MDWKIQCAFAEWIDGEWQCRAPGEFMGLRCLCYRYRCPDYVPEVDSLAIENPA